MPETPDRTPIANAALSIVLLLPDASADWPQVLHAWATYLDSLTRDYEILLVPVGDARLSPEETTRLTVEQPRVRVLEPVTLGVGAAIRTGLTAARFPLFGYVACTSAYQPADLGRMLDLIDHVDLVCGFRKGKARRPSLSPQAWVFRWLVRLVLGVHLKDVDCPFKLFRRSIFARIPIQSNSFLAHAEIVAKANFLGCLIAEVPVSCHAAQPAPRPTATRTPWREALRLIRHPDFGPPKLPQEG